MVHACSGGISGAVLTHPEDCPLFPSFPFIANIAYRTAYLHVVLSLSIEASQYIRYLIFLDGLQNGTQYKSYHGREGERSGGRNEPERPAEERYDEACYLLATQTRTVNRPPVTVQA